jgi:hypothetical protein
VVDAAETSQAVELPCRAPDVRASQRCSRSGLDIARPASQRRRQNGPGAEA